MSTENNKDSKEIGVEEKNAIAWVEKEVKNGLKEIRIVPGDPACGREVFFKEFNEVTRLIDKGEFVEETEDL